MRITVIGTGYVGLVTGTCLAEMGLHVVCLDIDARKVAKLQQGQIPFFEPGLAEMVCRNVKEKRLLFTTDASLAIRYATICLIAVDTPSQANGEADLSAFRVVVETIAEEMPEYRVIVNKSTVPVGTCERSTKWIEAVLQKRQKPLPFDVVSNPEFLKEGHAVADFMKPDRVIIGSRSDRAIALMKEMYAPFMWSRERLIVMDPFSAELSKYAANAMLATRISFMDELAQFCEKVGADIHQVRLGMGSDPRIGYDFLWAGVGYGGSCLPKDVRALLAQAQQEECSLGIVQAVDEANLRQIQFFFTKILSYFEGILTNKVFGILGLSFKPETDDLRSAPSLAILRKLLAQGAHLRLYDPVAMQKAKEHFPPSEHILYCENEEEVALDADALVLLTEWKQFRALAFARILENMRGRAFFDGRNQYDPKKMQARGFDYFSIGRPAAVCVREETLSLASASANAP